MPLFHVGGIVRNLLAPVISGGSAIMCSGFDPIAFWSLSTEFRATWSVIWLIILSGLVQTLILDRYYAAPTIHHAIISSRPPAINLSQDIHIRMICNAAGGLLPSLAAELKIVFSGAVILPSYGMTE
jgi:acyl-CoA synthetase (AMP-forming)/AMP-acid ligase II